MCDVIALLAPYPWYLLSALETYQSVSLRKCAPWHNDMIRLTARYLAKARARLTRLIFVIFNSPALRNHSACSSAFPLPPVTPPSPPPQAGALLQLRQQQQQQQPATTPASVRDNDGAGSAEDSTAPRSTSQGGIGSGGGTPGHNMLPSAPPSPPVAPLSAAARAALEAVEVAL